MKANLFYKITIPFVFALLSLSLQGQNKLTKNIKKTFPLTDNGVLYLENKYGDVLINGWDKDEIEISVTIEATGKSSEKAEERLKLIESDIKSANKQVVVKSVIKKKNKGFFNKYIGKIDPFNTEKSNTVINYSISLPKHADIEIINRYGDVIISDWNGQLNTVVEHGDIRILDNITDSDIAISYGNLRAKTLQNSKLTSKEASVSVKEANRLKLDSNGSEINIDYAEELELLSNKDDIEIEQLNTVFGSIKYSTVVLNTISEKLNLDLNLAELRVLKLSTAYPKLTVEQRASEVYINISDTNFKFDANLEQGVLRIPKSLQNINSEVIDKKRKIRNISASYNDGGDGRVSFKGFKGVIILKEL